MKYVLTIIAIVGLASVVLNGVANTQSDRECDREIERISVELAHIAEDLERTGNVTATINALRYQSEKADQFAGR